MADLQNPWLTGGTDPVPPGGGGGATVGQPAEGWGPGATVLSEGPAWLRPENQAPKDLSTYLDASKWSSWSDDDWRAATGGYGFEGGLMGQLSGLMGEDKLRNMIQTYGVGGGRYAPGRYDFANKKMVYDDMSAPMLAAANQGALWGGQNMSNPGGTGVWADKSNPLISGLNTHHPSTTGPAPINYAGALGITQSQHGRNNVFTPQAPTAMPKPTGFKPGQAPTDTIYTGGRDTENYVAPPGAPTAVAAPRPTSGLNNGAVSPTATQLRRNMFMP
jgi:hypothetical protein